MGFSASSNEQRPTRRRTISFGYTPRRRFRLDKRARRDAFESLHLSSHYLIPAEGKRIGWALKARSLRILQRRQRSHGEPLKPLKPNQPML